MKLNEIFDRYYIKQPRLRSAITKAVYGDRDVTIDLFGTKLLVNTLLENGYFRAYRMSLKSSLLRDEAPVLCNLSHLAKEGGAFVDVGANVGVYSGYFSRFAKLFSSFDVCAFEAAPSTFQRLKANADRLGFRAIHVALGAERGRVRFVEGAVSHVATLKAKQNAYSISGKEFEVECAPLSAYSFNGSDIILKIDVEGQEMEVLKGAEPMFEQARVCAVYCDGWTDPGVPRFLSRFGFAFFDGRTLERTSDPSWALLALRSDVR